MKIGSAIVYPRHKVAVKVVLEDGKVKRFAIGRLALIFTFAQ